MGEPSPRVLRAERIDLAISEHATRRQAALVSEDSSISYSELEQLVQSTARWVSDRVAKGCAVGVYMDNSPEAVLAILGSMRAGRTVVPINTKNDPKTVAFISDAAHVRLLLVSDRSGTRLTDWEGEVPVNTFRLADLPKGDFSSVQSDSEADAIIFFTSGSTGKPKGVVASYKNLVFGADSVAQYLDVTPGLRLGAVLPVSFDAGLNWLLTGLACGAEVHLLRYVFPRSLAADLAKHRIEALLAVPTVFHALSTVPAVDGTRGLRMASTGGRMDQETVHKLREAYDQLSFTVMYGLTEAFRATHLPDDMWHEHPTSIGYPIPHAEVHVLAEDGQRAKTGKVGEIVQSGPLVTKGYINAPQQQELRFGPTPVFSRFAKSHPVSVYSGDTGYMDDEGLLYFVGRKDRLIKSRGFRIAPEEIEKEVVARTELEKVVAFGEEDAAVGQKIVVVAEGDGHSKTTIGAIRQKLRGTVPDYMLPDELRWLPSFPLNSNGKFDVPKIVESVRNEV